MKNIIIVAFITCIWSCGTLDRNNPLYVDNSNSHSEQHTSVESEPSLTLAIALPKALASVVDSMVARFTGPDIVPIVKEMQFSPIGPATVTLGALSPGQDRTLIVEGYDHDGNLIIRGEKHNIQISVGDTTRITLNMEQIDIPADVESNGTDNSGDEATTG